MTQTEFSSYKVPDISRENGRRLFSLLIPLLELSDSDLCKGNDLKGFFLKDENNPGLANKLFVVYGKNSDINSFAHLENHKNYFAQYDTDDNKYTIIIFKLDHIIKELNIILDCKISTLPLEAKVKILKYNYGYIPYTNIYPKGIPVEERSFFPRTWSFKSLDTERIKLVKQLCEKLGIDEEKLEEYCSYEDPELFTFKGIIYE